MPFLLDSVFYWEYLSIYQALPYQEYMTHYWPIENGQMNDKIGSAHMIQGSLTSFTADRFGNVETDNASDLYR
jgi:hypothetical protein